jgi:ATP-dependent DNA helicase RecQ
MQIGGFGKAKAEKYGDEILEAVESYCEMYDLETNMTAKVANPKKEKKPKSTETKTASKTVSFELYKAGKDITEIAAARNFSRSTIEGHLAYFVRTGDIEINELVSSEKQQLIAAAVTEHGHQGLSSLIQNLPKDISYGEIRMVIAASKTIEVDDRK